VLGAVHHIDGSGEDAGVVYSEMQGRENSAESRMFYELQRTMFAGTGYAAETGGRLKDLRELTADTVRSYHKVCRSTGCRPWSDDIPQCMCVRQSCCTAGARSLAPVLAC
jgi:hypothetical protein